MAHIFFETLERRRNTQSLNLWNTAFSPSINNSWGTSPTSSYGNSYGSSTGNSYGNAYGTTYGNFNSAFSENGCCFRPQVINIALYGINIPSQKIPRNPISQNPYLPISPPSLYYGVNIPPNQWDPIGNIDWTNPISPIGGPIALYGISPPTWNPIDQPDWLFPIEPINPPVALYGISLPWSPSDKTDWINPIEPIGTPIAYYGISVPNEDIIDKVIPNIKNGKIDDWIYNQGRGNPKPIEIIPDTSPRIYPLYGIQLPIERNLPSVSIDQYPLY